MRRRNHNLGGAAAFPFAADAQSPMPVVGFLSSLSPSDLGLVVPGFYEGLTGVGLVEGRNIAIEYRWAQGDYRRLPGLSADLVNPKVAVLAAISGTPAALAAKAATSTIPIVFAIGGDPGPTRAGRQPEPTGRKRHRRELLQCTARDQAI